MSFYYLLKLYKLLKCICRNQFSMFFQICFSRDCESLAASIFRKDIAYSVKIFRRSLRLMENKKISFIFSIPVQSILACKESVQSMSCSNYIIQPGKNKQTDYINSGSFLFRLFFCRFFIFCRVLFGQCLQLGLTEFLKKIYDIICTVKGKRISLPLIFKRCKFGEAGIQFLDRKSVV